MIISVTFDPSWFFSGDGRRVLSAERLVALCREGLGEEIGRIGARSNACAMELNTDRTPDELVKVITELIENNILDGEEAEQVFRIDFLEDTAAAQGDGQPGTGAEGTAPEGAGPSEEEKKEPALDRIDRLVGAREFKDLCRGIHARAPFVREHHTESVLLSEVYLISADPGCGGGTAVGLLEDLLREEKILGDPEGRLEIPLPSRTDPELAQQIEQMVRVLPEILAKPHVVIFDLSGWVGHTHAEEFRRLLMGIFRNNHSSLVLFRLPYLNRNVLDRIEKDVEDILPADPVAFPPFSPEELRLLAERELKRYALSLAEDAWPVFDRSIEQESRDGRFYGVHTVRKVVNGMIRAAEQHSAQTGEGAELLTAAALAGLVPDDNAAAAPGLSRLEKMVGMAPVAQKVREIVNSIRFDRDNRGGMPGMHMCFTGNPGTGKSTTAKVIAAALKEEGVLSTGMVRAHRGRDLCGKYVGQTAPLTASVCRDAYGSVLYIDEAYTLGLGGLIPGSNDAGQEAIDTLVAEMDDHRDELVVIFAGYPEEMQAFLDMNPELRDRIPYRIDFPDFTREQLSDIFLEAAEKDYRCGDGFAERARAFFLGLPDEILEDRTLGNAVFVHSLYERVWNKAAMRCPGTAASELTLETADFDAAAEEMPELRRERPMPRIGF